MFSRDNQCIFRHLSKVANDVIENIRSILTSYTSGWKTSPGIKKSHPAVVALKGVEKWFSIHPRINASKGLKVEASCGHGNWTKIPWIAVFDLRISRGAREGAYPVMLFRADMSGFYLSLSIATDVPYGSPTKSRIAALKGQVASVSSEFDNLRLNGFSHDPTLDLRVRKGPGVGYMHGSVIHKFYDAQALSLSTLSDDLTALLMAYDASISSGTIYAAFQNQNFRLKGPSIKSEEEQKRLNEELRAVSRISDKKLIGRILKNATLPQRRPVETTVYIRSAEVIEYVRRHARGICGLCGLPAPFLDEEGKPFLEVHHVQWLARGGMDTPFNAVALCPNCHRRMHVLDKPDEVTKLRQKAYALLDLL